MATLKEARKGKIADFIKKNWSPIRMAESKMKWTVRKQQGFDGRISWSVGFGSTISAKEADAANGVNAVFGDKAQAQSVADEMNGEVPEKALSRLIQTSFIKKV